jgi:glycosyltransferase involved in cell wall biosynthesis
MGPKISVIIPTRNEEKVLKDTLKQFISIKKKFDIEIIVSDGGSTDSTLKIARKYADKVILAREGVKQNIAIGRNAGAKAAKGDIIFETDADVRIPQITKFFSAVQEKFKDPNILAITTKIKVYPNEEIFLDKIAHLIFNSTVNLSVRFGSIAGKGECQIIRTRVFNKIQGYDESIIVGEDGNIFYKIKKLGKIGYLNNLTVYHSPRRFRKEGYIKVFYQYIREGCCLFFKGKSYLQEWKPIR